MALWNRSSYLMIARLIPIVLILSAGFFWKYEKQVRLQAEKRLKTVSQQLSRSQEDLAEARRIAEAEGEEKRFLIQQLGERDEHIRRLLAEMIRLLSGSGSVDLGEVLVRTKAPGAWDNVNQELHNIVSKNPITTPPMTAAPAAGLRQIQVESRAIPSPMTAPQMPAAMQQAPTGPSQAKLFATLSDRSSQILTLNAEHKFVVINQGSQNGLKQDAIFDVFGGNSKIGRLQIGTIYDRISTASILDGDIKLFREGSMIRLEPAQ